MGGTNTGNMSNNTLPHSSHNCLFSKHAVFRGEMPLGLSTVLHYFFESVSSGIELIFDDILTRKC